MPAIPFLIVAGAQIYQNYAQNKAQNKAEAAQTSANATAQQQQTQAAGQAQNRIAETGATQAQLYSPYLNLGAGAASTLASRLGLPSGPAPGLTPGNVGTVPYSPNTQLTPVDPGNAQGIVTNPAGPPLSDGSVNDPRTRGTLAQLGTAVQRTQAQNQTQSGYVTMTNPQTGETAKVPAHQQAFFEAKGAKVVA